MGKFDKQLKYSIRKVSVGAASVVIGAFYLAMGAGVVHAETDTTGHSSAHSEYNTNNSNGLTGSNNQAVPAPNSVGENRDAGSSTENNEAVNSAVTERKGSTVQPDQPGINVPKGNEDGAHDPNAHISFDDPGHTATVEEMWKIIQHMPDDFQNNERTYLRNMDTLGRELRFDKTAENPEGVPLQPGEIRELHDFGGWHAIDKDGTQGKFVIGRKNAQGYFTGWHKVGETPEGIPIIEQGGMLGADALDNVYVHEQALDRRFDYMLMLVKGRTRANRNETVVDNSTYDPRTQNERAEAAGAASYNKLPFLEKDKFGKYSPGVVGYNGIEKKFTAFSTKYGSRVRVDFVTGYITDINGSKGSYRIVIKAQNSKGEETKVYDETISRVAEIVQNEELYKKGLNVEAAHKNILRFFKDEFDYRVNKIKNPKVRAKLGRTREKDYTPEQRKVYDQIVEEATEEVKKQGDIVMNVTEDFLSIVKSGKKDSEWKKTFTSTLQSPTKLSNNLNTLLRDADKDTPNTPTWLKEGSPNSNADDRAYRLLTTLIPGAKKITYHVNDDQLEVETDKYTYTAARDGSKEVGIQGSDIAATLSAETYNANPQTFDSENTNTKANNRNNGWAKSDSEEFRHFSRFLGVDKGIVRTNVISDEELSAKIKEAVGPGYSKLGKAGYFATADIPLGKDIVSYTVQVIPSDNERVGVNSQSSRIQYNMPILADFSVIQDTTEVSKELAKRIIGKSNLPEDKKNKIIEEINKSKKTSEIRSAMSKNVKVRYVDKATGNVITNIKNDKAFGEKDSENRYTAAKDVLINSNYNVTASAYATLSTTDDKYYRLVADNNGLATDSEPAIGTIGDTDKVVTFLYEKMEKPATPTTGKGVVHFKKQVSETVIEPLTGYGDITLEGNVGDTFSSTDVATRITALKNAGYEIVSDTFTNGDRIIDSTADVDGQDPSQVYNVIVREKVETVTTPPTPNTPVDPNVPEGPKWPTTGLAKSDLEKEVTRTINYFKKETADGEKIANAKPTKVDKVLYKRTATYNLVSKTVTYSKWTATADDTHTATSFSSVKTPVLTGYVADFKEVTDAPAAPNEKGEVTNMTKEVVYTKIGSWVPNKPGEKTPTPIPYPNDPDDATKPKYPDYPKTPENPDGGTPGGGTPGGGNENPGDETPGTPEKPKTPELPVIPYEPGYTPGIPTDPTQPVDPKENPLVPLKPVDPKNPKKGYKVPEIPEKPGKDTPITYVADPQKALVKVVKVEGEGDKKTETPLKGDYVNINGKTGEEIPDDSVTAKIADLEKRGYVIENKDDVLNFIKEKFDKDQDTEGQDPTQTVTLKVHEKLVPVTPPTDDKPLKPETPIDPDAPVDPKNPNDPIIPRWTDELIKKLDVKKEVTRTINYVDEKGNIVSEKSTDKVTFTREAEINVVTGEITYGKWTAKDNDTTFEAVTSPVVKGYILKANQDTQNGLVSTDGISVVASTNLTATSENQNVNVVYTKLGSWVPKVPGVETPTPLPYPNHPTDPTKPGTPVYPEPGTPTDPNTPKPPVIPYVPGYTPKFPNDPTKPVSPENPLVPLQPVDPNHPENGYKVPPVPTKPGTNTDITYVADPQKAVVKVFNTTTGTEVELPAEKVSIDNGTTDAAIPTTDLNTKIADLEKRGYVVENKNLLENQKFDKVKDPETGDPTQVFKLKVHEKVVEVTEPPTPNTPVDPNVPVEPNKPVDPTVPKWPAEGLKESDLKKEVTRTITYVKKETADGKEEPSGKDPVTQTAHFTRKASYNVVTGTITYGNWESTDKELAKVDTPELTGYVADKASVDKVETNVNSTGLDKKVVYTKLGSWVPNLPEGVKPPEGTDMTPKPYPNNPDDPTKPKDPEYPQPGQPITPGTPIIPYVPGYTPKTPDGNPLVPVDPEHPGKGYKVPPVPETPGTNTDITYAADPQKAVVKVFNTTTGTEVELPAEKVSIDNGTTDAAIPTTDLNTKIADLEKRGYVVENKNLLENQKFDKEKDPTDGDPTQVFKLLVKERTVTVTEPKNPNDPVDPDKPEGPKWPATGLAKSDLEKEVTRTITYVKKETADGPEIADAKPTKKQTAHFKRSATYNLVTKVVTPGEWTSTDKTLEAVPTEKLDGYVANVPSVEEVEINANSTNLDRKVVYTKLGSWVPKVPGVETPTPLPYPNNPTDPTTPGTPVYPEPGTPTDPNTPKPPVIPYVPGYTPGIPTDPTKPVDPNTNPLVPLVPVDPEHPENGYKVPPVPTKPGEDTPITYEANPQKALVKVVKVEGEGDKKTETPLTADYVNINGKTGEEIPDDSVTDKIADLEKRGYIIENKDDVLNFIKEKFDKDKDTEGQDPTQTVTLKVHEKVVTVTEPPTPKTPIDPENPNGPKWTEELVNQLSLKKDVTRTINYVDEAGNKVSEPSTDKVTFTREARINVVTGEITYGDWTSTDKTYDAVKSPVVKGYILKDPSQKVVEKETVKSDAKDETITVTYTKVGSFVPKVPEGVTPKTPLTPTPYDNDPEDPTKVVTPNPEKPQDPKDPNSPKVPVIPQVPGHTPVVPKDPTKPVSPENPLVPLTPVDPNHPEKGYNVPPVPTIPGQDTPITYVKDGQQKAITSFVDPKGNVLETPITETGDSNTPLTKDGEIKATIAKLKLKGYDVETNTYPPKGTFDNDPKVDQYFKVTLTPRVKPVKPFDPTNPKDPNKPVPGQPIDPDTPVDPNNPNDPTIPRWTDELIKKLDVKKEVTRTINYVDEAGNKVSEPSTDKVTFTREAKINVVTGEITYGNWTSTDKTYDAVKSPVVKGYILKDAKQKEVASETVRPDSEDETITVTYTKVGSFVPKVPEGVTPKTPLTPTPYDNDPEDPTKVVTPNPEKPQDPKDPNSPKVPVIPQVPGHTPVVPKDPTKPVSPENPLVPLTPVDPNHPEKGYNVPPVPTTPGQDTPITYVKDGQQKAITSFVDPKGNVLETPITETGDSNTPLTKDGEIKATIAKLKLKGYDVETNTYPPKGTFDNDPKVDQYFKVTLTPRVKPVKPFDPTDPKDPNKPVPGQPIDPDTPVDPNNPNDPTIPRWTDELIKKLDVKKEVTRTINYVDEKGNKVSEKSTDKVTFTREAKINVVTGEITYGDWKAVGGDSTFDKVSSPVVKGYILKDPAQKEVAERKGITPTVANQTIEVVYKKLGSWVPRIPDGVTPPTGTDMTPKPYPNDPKDPTKPGTPEYPQPGQPITPGTPVIPYIPGYTPKIGDKPLEPVDPNHPENGYKVPPVPTEPGNDTPIEYVKVPNTPSPEEPVKPTPESNHITIWVDENGKPLKPEQPGTHEAGNIPGYRFITTTTKDGVTIHRFEKISPVEPNNPVPQKPTTPIPTPNTPEANTPTSETNRREELPNTGTEANANLAALGLLGALSGFGLLARKKKED